VNQLDAVVHVLGIEEDEIEPAEEIKRRLRQQIKSSSSASYAVGDVIGESQTKEVRVSRDVLADIHVALTSIRDSARGHPFGQFTDTLDIERIADEAITKLLTLAARGDSGETKGVMEPHTYPKDTCKRCAELREQGFRSR
jgi:hypothetical protein